MGLASLSEVVPAKRSASSVSRSPFAVSHRSGPGHGVFQDRRRRVNVEDVRAPPLRGLASPSEYYRAGLPSPLGHGASQEFLPLQRMQMREPTHPGFASSRFGCGCRVSHPLAAFRLPRPSDLFRPVTLMGFSPSKPLPPGGAVAPLGARCPLAVVRTRRRSRSYVRPLGKPGFRALLPAGVRHDRTGVSRSTARCSPGVPSL